MKFALKKAINYRDGKLKELDLDLDALTGYDILSVESELRSAGVQVPAWEYSREFLLGVAARASKMPVDALKNLGVRDFTNIINEVLIFLAGTATDGAAEKNSGE